MNAISGPNPSCFSTLNILLYKEMAFNLFQSWIVEYRNAR